MHIGPKYKIARRLGSAVFEKTQTAKFSLNEQKKTKNLRQKRPSSVFGQQLIEKQKVRFTYCIVEKQLKNYVKKVIETSKTGQSDLLFKLLENRLDNVVLKSGFVKSRLMARQAVSHGHFTVNGVRVNIPSYAVKKDDVIAVREGSKSKKLFENVEKSLNEANTPAWLKVNAKDLSVKITGEATYVPQELHFDLNSVMEYYKK
ncbi:MAG: ribosomal protein small subunit ribosomal protein [Candidatus Parcubacteria bacterium]|jgi:small subunit ribosomal protein S4